MKDFAMELQKLEKQREKIIQQKKRILEAQKAAEQEQFVKIGKYIFDLYNQKFQNVSILDLQAAIGNLIQDETKNTGTVKLDVEDILKETP